MIAITLGFKSRRKDASPEVLYCGMDADAAREKLLAPPAGILRTELLKNPRGKRRFHTAPEEAAEAAEAEEVKEEEPPAEEKPAEKVRLPFPKKTGKNKSSP